MAPPGEGAPARIERFFDLFEDEKPEKLNLKTTLQLIIEEACDALALLFSDERFKLDPKLAKSWSVTTAAYIKHSPAARRNALLQAIEVFAPPLLVVGKTLWVGVPRIRLARLHMLERRIHAAKPAQARPQQRVQVAQPAAGGIEFREARTPQERAAAFGEAIEFGAAG